MSSLRITRRRTTQLVWTTILTLSCVIVFIDVDGLKAKPLEYECLNGAWTNDGTPFEEPELNADATCLSNHDHRSHECEPQAAVQAVRPARETTPSPRLTHIVSFLFRLGWMR
jgi:hypothetical protein